MPTHFRRLEKADLKYRRASEDMNFLETCVTNKFVPKFIRFKLYQGNLQDSQSYHKYQKKLLEEELGAKINLKYEEKRRSLEIAKLLEETTSNLN